MQTSHYSVVCSDYTHAYIHTYTQKQNIHVCMCTYMYTYVHTCTYIQTYHNILYIINILRMRLNKQYKVIGTFNMM